MSSFDRDDLQLPAFALATGPTGPNGEFVVGDIIAGPAGPMRVGEKEVPLLNKRQQEFKEKVALANLTRVNFVMDRRCAKCGCTATPAIHYRPSEADCQEAHGSEEHFDRQCIRCHFVWAENVIDMGTSAVVHRCGAHPTANIKQLDNNTYRCAECGERLRTSPT